MSELFVTSTDSESLREALGITEERCKELCNLVHKIDHAHEGKLSISEILSKASTHCRNANELAFVSFTMGTYVKKNIEVKVEHIVADDMPEALQEMIKRMLTVKSRGSHSFAFGQN